MPLRVERETPTRRIEMSMFANTGKDIEHLSALWGGVLHAIGSEKRKVKGIREVDQLFVSPIFPTHQMPLDFDKHVIAAKRLDEKLCAISKILVGAIDPNRPRTAYCPRRAGDSANR